VVLPVSPTFSVRAVSMMRAAVAEFGGQRAAARALSIPISTFRANILGRVLAPSTGTVARLAEAYSMLDGGVQQRLRGGADLMVGLTDAEVRQVWEEAAQSREMWQGATDLYNDRWHSEQRRREEQGAPPLESGSP